MPAPIAGGRRRAAEQREAVPRAASGQAPESGFTEVFLQSKNSAQRVRSKKLLRFRGDVVYGKNRAFVA